MKDEKAHRTISLDFDGVIHQFLAPWKGADIIPDPPVEGAFDFMNMLLLAGYTVMIYSTRNKYTQGIQAMKDWLQFYEFHNVNKLQFPTDKPPAILFIDDRGFHFNGKWPLLEFVDTFKPWNRQ